MAAAQAATPGPPGVVRAEFVYEAAPFPQCHASTLAETKGALVAAWFGGPREGDPRVGIWLDRHYGKAWSAPVEVANGVESPQKRFPCWNPVLFQPKSRQLLLFYKVGPSPRAWWGMLMASEEGGKTWSKPERLPEGILGPIKNKPIQLPSGELLCGSSTEDAGWRVHFERSPDVGKTWQKIGPVNDGKAFGAIQPTLLTHGTRTQALCRSRQGRIVQVWSDDGGKEEVRVWSPPPCPFFSTFSQPPSSPSHQRRPTLTATTPALHDHPPPLRRRPRPPRRLDREIPVSPGGGSL